MQNKSDNVGMSSDETKFHLGEDSKLRPIHGVHGY